MSNIWERFNDIANANEVAEARAKYTPLEAGTYVMKLEKIGMGENKDGLPLAKGQFITETNKTVYYNQPIQNINYPEMTADNIRKVVEMIEGLTGEEYTYSNFVNLAETLDNIPTGGMYNIKVSYGKKDTDMKYAILTCTGAALSDDDLPFTV